MSFPTTAILDNFNRANENPLSGGGNWTRSGTFDIPFQLFSNGVIGTGGTNQNQMSYSAAGDLTACEVYATVVTAPGSGNSIGVIARQDPAVNTGKNYYDCLYIEGLGVLIDYYNSAGSVTTLATYSQTVSAGDSIGLSAIGTTLTAWYKPSAGSWTSLGSVTDSNLSHGYIGVTGFPLVGGGKLDDFGGGAYVAPPDTGVGVSEFAGAGSDMWAVNRAGIAVSPFAATATDTWVLNKTGVAISSFAGGGFRPIHTLPESFASARVHLPASTTTGQIREAQGVMQRLADIGETDYYHLQVYFPSPWIDASSEGVAIMQPNWQDLSIHAPVMLRARGNHVDLALRTGQVSLDTSGAPVYSYDNTSPDTTEAVIPTTDFGTEEWHELVVAIAWATNNAGSVQVWHRLSGATAWTQTVALFSVPTFQYGTLVTGHTWNQDGTDGGGNVHVTYDKAGGYALYGTSDVVLYHATLSRHATFSAATGEQTGAALAAFSASGFVQWVLNRTGTGISAFAGSGPKLKFTIYPKSGTGISDRAGKGADAWTKTKRGTGIIDNTTGGGPSAWTKTKTGKAVIDNMIGSGTHA